MTLMKRSFSINNFEVTQNGIVKYNKHSSISDISFFTIFPFIPTNPFSNSDDVLGTEACQDNPQKRAQKRIIGLLDSLRQKYRHVFLLIPMSNNFVRLYLHFLLTDRGVYGEDSDISVLYEKFSDEMMCDDCELCQFHADSGPWKGETEKSITMSNDVLSAV